MRPRSLVPLLALACSVGSVGCVVYRTPPPARVGPAAAPGAAPVAGEGTPPPPVDGTAVPVDPAAPPVAADGAPAPEHDHGSAPEGGDQGGGPMGGMHKMMMEMHHKRQAEARITDHERIIGRWGVEARHIEGLDLARTRSAPVCLDGEGKVKSPCSVGLNAISVRRWVNNHYAWSAGLILGASGGSTTRAPGVEPTGSWDAYFGVGPTFGANFLLSQWKHMTVSASPQLDMVFFLPSSSGAKTVALAARGVLEAEIHLGFIGLPALSVGTSTGLALNYTKVTNGDASKADLPKYSYSTWGVGLAGPQTLLGVVNNAFLRFYF